MGRCDGQIHELVHRIKLGSGQKAHLGVGDWDRKMEVMRGNERQDNKTRERLEEEMRKGKWGGGFQQMKNIQTRMNFDDGKDWKQGSCTLMKEAF